MTADCAITVVAPVESRSMTSLPANPPLEAALFDNPDEVLWLMHCSEGPVPRAAADAVVDFLPRETHPWKLRWREDFQAIPERTREAAARVIGADPYDITLTPTTSSGLVTIAQTFPWHHRGAVGGGEIVLPRGEFPSNVWPWKALAARGVNLREVPLWDGHEDGTSAWQSAPPRADIDPEERLLAALGPHTQVLAVSWVRFQDGIVLDLERLARGCAEKRVALVVDGIQGAGTRVPQLDGVSAFATGGHKGLLAPQGLGILWTDRTFRREIVPGGSWLSVEQAMDFSRPSTDTDRDWATDGTRLEQGMPNLVSAVAFHQSLDMLARAGVEAIQRHIASLASALIDGLETLDGWRSEALRLRELHDAGRLGSIIALHHGDRGPKGMDRLLSQAMGQKIYPSVREGYLRIAFHGWHTKRDVERVLHFLRASAAADIA